MEAKVGQPQGGPSSKLGAMGCSTRDTSKARWSTPWALALYDLGLVTRVGTVRGLHLACCVLGVPEGPYE